ncbi:MAG: NUDIX hydrolase [candidate division WOR-3 bacterium]|nr:NUDIX hydrolase [candidate division WOR-3 bacterium]
MEKKIDSEKIYSGRIIDVRKDTVETRSGLITTREIVSHRGAAAMLAYEEKTDSIYLVRQFRYAVNDYLIELPAGTLEEGESPRDCALRELREETGIVASTVEQMTVLMPSPGYSDELIYLFLCSDFKYLEQSADDDENIEIMKLSVSSMEYMIMDGTIKDAKTITAFLLWARHFSQAC